MRGSSGIVPKVKINYTEIGQLAGVSKDAAENGCKLIFKDISDKVKQGMNVSLPIPFVGTFRSRGNIAAIQFNESLIKESLGKTNKQFFEGKLFASNNNRLNMEILNHD